VSMRRGVLHIAVTVALWNIAALGQGAYFSFQNASARAPVAGSDNVPLAGTNYLAELFGGPDPEGLMPALGDSGGQRVQVPFVTLGYVRGATVRIPSVPDSGWTWLQMRAWDARLGKTYEEVVVRGLGGYGESPRFYAKGSSGPLCTGVPCAPALLIGLQSFSLRPITPAVLMRSARREGSQVVIEWHPGFKRYQLQQSAALGQPWQNAGEPTTATSVTNSVAGSAQFFRVIGLLE